MVSVGDVGKAMFIERWSRARAIGGTRGKACVALVCMGGLATMTACSSSGRGADDGGRDTAAAVDANSVESGRMEEEGGCACNFSLDQMCVFTSNCNSPPPPGVLQTGCAGTVMVACPSVGLIGCCVYGDAGMSCYYSGDPDSGAAAMAACQANGGTLSGKWTDTLP
jgi:hypothetical protein